MTYIIIGISFTLIWLGTCFHIIRYIRGFRKELFQKKAKEYSPDEDKENTSTARPFEFFSHVDSNLLLSILRQEHPQVIALVLAYLEPNKSSAVLQGLPCEVQVDILHRIADIDHVDPVVCSEIELVLEKKLSTLSSQRYPPAGGIESAAEILNLVDDTSRNHIIEKIEYEDPKFAEKINLSLAALRKK